MHTRWGFFCPRLSAGPQLSSLAVIKDLRDGETSSGGLSILSPSALSTNMLFMQQQPVVIIISRANQQASYRSLVLISTNPPLWHSACFCALSFIAGLTPSIFFSLSLPSLLSFCSLFLFPFLLSSPSGAWLSSSPLLSSPLLCPPHSFLLPIYLFPSAF